MIPISRTVKTFVRNPIINFQSLISSHHSTLQTESPNNEKHTHFGFEQVKESEKQKKGKVSTKDKIM